MTRLEVRLQFAPERIVSVGRLALQAGRSYCEFDPAFVSAGVPISPFRLPLRSGLIEHRDPDVGPLPGVFADSLPDGWGRLLMDRHFRRLGMRPAEVSVLQRLAWLGTRTLGALTYHPCTASESDAATLDLAQMATEVDQVLSGDVQALLPELLRAGGSPAGARPKLLVGLCGEELRSGEDDLAEGFFHWIVKVPTQAEGWDAGRVEHAYALMARAAGLPMPSTRLLMAGERACFAVQRFDRGPENQRLHMHSLANLLHADFRIPSLDYADLLRACQVLTRHQGDVQLACRQMLFNVVAHNRDDHGKNFAFLMDSAGQWRLSPPFDLCPSDGPGGEHSTSIMGEGRQPDLSHCLAVAKQAGVRKNAFQAMVEELNQAIDRWPDFADEAGVSASRTRELAQRHRLL